MTQHDALLAAIIARPEDDTVRLVYADWLEENGQPERAEFVRVQVELAKYQKSYKVEVPPVSQGRTENTPEELRFVALLRREQELFDADESAGWHGFLLDLSERSMVDRLTHEPVWRRGFIDELRTDGGTDTLRVLELMKRQPVRVLCCTLADWCGGECLTCSAWGRVTPNPTGSEPCPDCSGTGRTPGIGPAVVRSHPVMSVVLTGVVRRSAVRGSRIGVLTREAAGPLYDMAFPDTHGRIEGNADRLEEIMSEVAIRWAKSQPTHAVYRGDGQTYRIAPTVA